MIGTYTLDTVQTEFDLSPRTSIGRWSRVGPYYAMFPVDHAFQIVSQYCPTKGAVLDPFAGRASSIYAAAVQGKSGYGIEIHPVGWVYGTAKLRPAHKTNVSNRLRELRVLMNTVTETEIDALPPFFHHCYCRNVLKFLLAARSHLQWESSADKNIRQVDTTLMALLLVHLHGKLGSALSNQIRQGKAMDPNYSVRWWTAKGMRPPEIDPITFMAKRIEYRYKKGVPNLEKGHVERGDSTKVLSRIAGQRAQNGNAKFDLVLTSPPYQGVTNYFYDQWLRLWLLGWSATPQSSGKSCEGRFESKANYRELLLKVFQGCAKNTHDKSVIYVRTDARQFTLETTKSVLLEVFPEKAKRMKIELKAYTKSTQTALYGDKSKKPGEVDIILQ